MRPHTRTQKLSRWKVCYPYPPPPQLWGMSRGVANTGLGPPPTSNAHGVAKPPFELLHKQGHIYRRKGHRTKTAALCNSSFNNTCTGTTCATPFESQFSVSTLYGDVHGRSLWAGIFGTHIARKNRNRIGRCKFVGGRGERTGAEFPIVAMHTHKEKIQRTPYSGGKKSEPEVYRNPKIANMNVIGGL